MSTKAEQIRRKTLLANVRVTALENALAHKQKRFRELNITNDKIIKDRKDQEDIAWVIQAGLAAKVLLVMLGRTYSLPSSLKTDLPYIKKELKLRDYINNPPANLAQLEDIMKEGDKARQIFIMSNQGFAHQETIKIMRKKNLPSNLYEELLEEALYGLINAIDRYDPTSGKKITTYATFWIRQKIIAYLDDKMQMIRVSTSMNSVHKNIEYAKRALLSTMGTIEITPEMIYEWLQENTDKKTTLKEIKQAINTRKETISLDIAMDDEGTKKLIDNVTTNDYIEEDYAQQEDNHALEKITTELVKQERISQLQANIIKEYYENTTYKDQVMITLLTTKYNISKNELKDLKKNAEDVIKNSYEVKDNHLIPKTK